MFILQENFLVTVDAVELAVDKNDVSTDGKERSGTFSKALK